MIQLVAKDGERLPRVYVVCFGCQYYPMMGELHSMVAMSEDGDCLATHVSTSHEFGKRDMEHCSKENAYKLKYPGGYVLEWVADAAPGKHEGLDRAVLAAKAKKMEMGE